MGLPIIADLKLWYLWHSERGTLPDEVSGMNLREVYKHLGFPVWDPLGVWKRETTRIRMEDKKTSEERIVVYTDTQTRAEFTAKWSVGPDGDLWQTEYPVKKAEELCLFEALVKDEEIHLDDAQLSAAVDMFLHEGIGAIELPLSPFPRLLLEMLGFTQGFMVLVENQDGVEGMIHKAREHYCIGVKKILDKIEKMIASKAPARAGENNNPFFAVLPDNIDASFITPPYFEAYMADVYKNTASLTKKAGLDLMVHTGGPVAMLLEQIKDAGIHCLAGVSGPPQSDASLKEAREKVGPDMKLWGGIPQDCLIRTVSEQKFLSALEQAKAEADDKCIIGIADHVPVEASWERLKQTAAFFRDA